MSFFNPKKPYTAVTVTISKLVLDEQIREDEVIGIPELVESISLQRTGPSEAARAIRKQLKYGNVKCQLRSLTLLDGLIQNCGLQFRRSFVDEMLLERLRICGTSDLTDPRVKAKCHILFKSWATEYKNTEGLEQIAALYKQLPRHKQLSAQGKFKAPGEIEKNPFKDENSEVGQKKDLRSSSQTQNFSSPISLARSSWSPLFSGTLKKNVSKEKEKTTKYSISQKKTLVKNSIAEASVAATCLMNVLRSMSNQQDQISRNEAALSHLKTCKSLRKTIINYIQNIDDEELISALLHANDQLVNAITIFEQLTNSTDADSDSDDEFTHQNNHYNLKSNNSEGNHTVHQLASINTHQKSDTNRLALPSRQDLGRVSLNEDEDNPFADRNAVSTPMLEASNFEWKETET
ncbi:hypothetical protein K3495_g7674 [Podosphaera aphanis]|nr:hypothetical protein K3495_g7674 [Podosphaera aphanis]